MADCTPIFHRKQFGLSNLRHEKNGHRHHVRTQCERRNDTHCQGNPRLFASARHKKYQVPILTITQPNTPWSYVTAARTKPRHDSIPLSGSRGVLDDGHGGVCRVGAAHEVRAQLLQATDRHQEDGRLLRVVVADVRSRVVLSVTGAQGYLSDRLVATRRVGAVDENSGKRILSNPPPRTLPYIRRKITHPTRSTAPGGNTFMGPRDRPTLRSSSRATNDATHTTAP